MTSRRALLQVAALSVPALGMPCLAGSVWKDAPAGSGGAGVGLWLLDGRYAEAHALGAHLGPAAPVRLLPQVDLTGLWLREIAPCLHRPRFALAGLTPAPVLVCLEQLTVHAGLRVVLQGEHVIRPDGQAAHALLRGFEEAGLHAPDLTRAGPLWPARLAAGLLRHRRQARPVRVGLSCASPAVPAGATLLTSWIIARP